MELGDFVGLDVTVHSLRAYVAALKTKASTVRPLLFTGPTGSGKTSLAQAFAVETAAPILDTTARIDWEEVSSFVLLAKRPVVLVESVDQMAEADADDFLVRASRLLNPNVQWVFTARSETKVPVPLLARSVSFRMLPLDAETLTAYAVEKGLVEPEDAPVAVRMSGGYVGPLERHAEALRGGFDSHSQVLRDALRILVAVVRGDRSGAATGVEEFLSSHGSADLLLARLEDALSEVLTIQTGAPASMPALSRLASMVPESRVIALLKSVWQMQDRVTKSDPHAVVLALKAGMILLASQFSPVAAPVLEEVVEKDSGSDVVSIHEMRNMLLQKGSA